MKPKTSQAILAFAAVALLATYVFTRRPGSVNIKPGVSFEGLQTGVMDPVLDAAAKAAALFGKPAVVTSGTDHHHKRKQNSKHAHGHALDFRRIDRTVSTDGSVSFPDQAAARYQARVIADELGPQYDVVLEGDHIHVEYDP